MTTKWNRKEGGETINKLISQSTQLFIEQKVKPCAINLKRKWAKVGLK